MTDTVNRKFVGGPMDGQLIAMQPGHTIYEYAHHMPIPKKFPLDPKDMNAGVVERKRYYEASLLATGHARFLLHQDLTIDQAAEKLLAEYQGASTTQNLIEVIQEILEISLSYSSFGPNIREHIRALLTAREQQGKIPPIPEQSKGEQGPHKAVDAREKNT